MTDGSNSPDVGRSHSSAPEDLVVDFLNTLDVEYETDELTTLDELARWAGERDLEPGDLDQTIALRTALREIASGRQAELPRIALHPVLDDGAVGFAPTALAESVLAAVVDLSAQGRFRRIRLCRADDCALAFYDHSRNSSRTWCAMGDCGNREKARAYRSRQR